MSFELLGKSYDVTIKHDIVPSGPVYYFTDLAWLARFSSFHNFFPTEATMPNKPTPKALITPFNLFPDGGESTRVVGVGLSSFTPGGCLAVFLIFADNGGMQMSISAPMHAAQADSENECFFRYWPGVPSERAADVCIKEGLFIDTGKPAVQVGDRQVSIYRLELSKLRDMTHEELARHPAQGAAKA